MGWEARLDGEILVLERISCRDSGDPSPLLLIALGNRPVHGQIYFIYVEVKPSTASESKPETMSKEVELIVYVRKKTVSEGSKMMHELIL